MTLPVSGAISLSQIQSEFNIGQNLNAYRSQRWYLDTNGRGYFPSGTISFSDFYSKRKASPVTPSPSGGVTYNTVGDQTIKFPAMFNSLTVTAVSGQGGTAGQSGNCRAGDGGGPGVASNFGTYAQTSTGAAAGYGGSGSTSTASSAWTITDANQADIISLYNQGVASTIGAGGAGGGAGAYKNTVCACAYGVCVCADNCDQNLNRGSAGGKGYINLAWT